jgi:2'-hydroxyisoflavone reductase
MLDRREFMAAATLAAAGAAASSWSAEKARQPLRILLLGGTRFIGVPITELALKRGHTVTFFNRGKTNTDVLPQIERITGDRNGQLDGLKDRKWDAVIDTSAYVPRVVKLSTELLAPNVGQYLLVCRMSGSTCSCRRSACIRASRSRARKTRLSAR